MPNNPISTTKNQPSLRYPELSAWISNITTQFKNIKNKTSKNKLHERLFGQSSQFPGIDYLNIVPEKTDIEKNQTLGPIGFLVKEGLKVFNHRRLHGCNRPRPVSHLE